MTRLHSTPKPKTPTKPATKKRGTKRAGPKNPTPNAKKGVAKADTVLAFPGPEIAEVRSSDDIEKLIGGPFQACPIGQQYMLLYDNRRGIQDRLERYVITRFRVVPTGLDADDIKRLKNAELKVNLSEGRLDIVPEGDPLEEFLAAAGFDDTAE